MFNSIPPFKTNIMKYKEKLEGFPEEVVEKMLERQVEQGNKRDVSVFECHKSASINSGGFYWSESEEGNSFWEEVISNKNFDIFCIIIVDLFDLKYRIRILLSIWKLST